MDIDAPHAQENEYGSSPWVDIGGFEPPPVHHSPPMPDFHHFSYGPAPVMPMEPAYSLSIPPPYTALHLTMPSHPWPSMLTTQSNFSDSTLSPAPAPTLSIPQPAPIRRIHTPASTGPTPRRTLTDEDRRRMCLYHEENKNAKQTDIGALFGVERSTVSKVLRQKEKYLNMDDGSRSPIKRSKGRVPDIEKALANWARNYQRQGYTLTDAMIREKAHFFATTCGSPDGKEKVLSASWLEKFKQKHNLMGSKSRKNSVDATASETESPVRLKTSSSTQTSNNVSPISPTGLTTPSPLSPSQNQESAKKELSDGPVDLTKDYQHAHSQSTTSLETAPSLSASVTSPTSPLVSDSPYTPSSRSRLPSFSSNASRPRSQTFPLAAVDPSSTTANGAADQPTPKNILEQSLSTSVFDSPLEEEPETEPATGDASVIKRNRSNPEIKTTSMQPPPLPKSSTVSPVTTPGSPTQDEARRALELVWNYFQNQPSGLAPQECMTIGKLMEKLDIARNQANVLPARLERIEEHADSPRVSKKRSIHSLT
ncbi:hypothetical protein VTN77DRAFT_75 [Rasamsonia byssochlamydoides]|uniref:uncharacterized protein n=1 Tax=Rasamsonia byssochlamydoides TaxID=89139 RepID=UPI003742FA21